MAKKKTTPEPVTAEEPERDEEELPFEYNAAEVKPSPRQNRSGERKSYGARSARERRAIRGGESVRKGTASPRREKRSEGYSAEVIAELLENPTITVTEEELRRDYSYVLADLRSMGVLAAALIVTLVLLAQFLPK